MNRSLQSLKTPGHAPLTNALSEALAHFDRTAVRLGLDSGTTQLLRAPLREYRVHGARPHGRRHHKRVRRHPCAAQRRAWAVQGRDTVSPIGRRRGCASACDVDDMKSAVVDLPLGGAKAAIVCDPRSLSLAEQERLCRGWVRQMARNLGPQLDVPAPDVMPSGQHMLWMLDEFETIFGAKVPAFITGKPVGLGGSPGRAEATGYGVVAVLLEALRRLGLDQAGATASIQGFGNVAQHAAKRFVAAGGRVTAVSSWDAEDRQAYTFRKRSGVDPDALAQLTDRFGTIDRLRAAEQGYEVLPGSAWIEQEVDVLVPAGLENQITTANAPRIHGRVRVIAEAANGPTTSDAGRLLEERGILILPNIVANAGGVTCSSFEQVQGQSNYYWDAHDVLQKVASRMTAAFTAVHERAQREQLSLRDAAYLIAVERVAHACRERGWV